MSVNVQVHFIMISNISSVRIRISKILSISRSTRQRRRRIIKVIRRRINISKHSK